MASNPSGSIAWLKDEALAAWAGVAVGLAIPLALWISDRRQKLAAEKAAEKAKAVEKLSDMDRLVLAVQEAHQHVSRLTHNPDDEGALARNWRADDNSVKRKLAQIQSDLDRLRSIPYLDIPAGQAGAWSVKEVIEALNIAKIALEQEQEPISRDAMERISEAVESARQIGTKGIIRSAAARRSMKASLDDQTKSKNAT